MYWLDFFLLCAFGEQHEAADEVPQRYTARAASAGRVQPFGNGDGHAIPQHVLGERRSTEELRPAC